MKLGYVFMVFLMLFSCNRNAYEAPENLISEEQMVEVLYDHMLLNAAKGINKKILEKHIANPTQYIFDKYNIDSTQFAQSNTYYAHNSEVYASIYNRLKERLELDKKIMEDLVAEEKKKRDSIRKVKTIKSDSLTMLKYGQKKLTPRKRLPLKKIDSLQQLNQ